ncbi:AVT1A [Symbiodinium natans]|uniref:AVT1A protein n=1 Tax=Symbiodinium natans TaxID=878477 RepID=A0A812UU10_9DINO|nr:AVT1A [Symbiodinium natans]
MAEEDVVPARSGPLERFISREPRPDYVRRAALAYACTQVGAGLLALGPAVGHAGWVGIPVIVLCACCAAYTSYLFGWIMFQVQELFKNSRSPSYEDIGYQAMGTFGRLLSQLLQWLMLLGVCTIFLVLIGINAWQLQQIFGVQWLSKRNVILVAAALELIPCFFMATVKETFFLTALGALCSAICAVVVVVAAFTTDSSKMAGCLDGQANSWPWFADFQGLCLCWNTVVFAFGGINVLPSLLADFHTRGVLARALVSFTWRSYFFIILVYVAVAAAGFAVGGTAMASKKVDSNVLIGLSGCPDGEGKSISWSLVVAYSVITLHVLLAYPVPFHSIAETMEATLGTRDGALKPGLRGLAMRTPRLLFLGLCTLLAYTLPFFGALLDVVAAVAGQGTVFILPVLFSVAIQWQQGLPVRCYEWILSAICLLVGVLGAITGLYYGIQELASALK